MAKKSSGEVAEAMGVDLGPSLYISDKQYSKIGDLKVGQTLEMTITAKVVSVSEDQYSSEKRRNASLRIQKINGKSATERRVDYDDED